MQRIARSVFNLIFRELRVSQPWKYKAPFLICVPYLFFIAGHSSFSSVLSGILNSLVSGIGVAGFGYFSNDLADRKADAKAGIANGTQDLNSAQIISIFIFFLTAAIIPWIFYFPLNRMTIGLLAGEFLLFVMYAVRPFRLKERGFAGIVTDALYAHAVPAILAMFLFHAITYQAYPNFVMLLLTLGSWQFFHGLRNILQHQILDAANDRAAGTKTFALQIGESAACKLMKAVFIPLELSGFILTTITASLIVPALALAWPLYAVICWIYLKRQYQKVSLLSIHNWLYFFMDYYMLRWMPLVILVTLCIQDARMSVVLLLHLILFDNGLTEVFKKLLAYSPATLKEKRRLQ
jgi:4-hydroxybenzoate polyprenyltransferase